MSAAPLLPGLPASESPRLIGIARLAFEGDALREGHNVEYFSLPSRSLLNRCVSKRNLPFEWAINPYRGCEFACKYCYARYTHEFMELRDGIDFERKIYVKQHAAELLRQELRQVKAGEEIAIGTATDPYQPAERRWEVTRSILEELARHRGLSIGIVTKSNLILRDVALLRELGKLNRVFVSLTITTLDVDLARLLEPRAPRPDLRMEAVRQLNLAGVSAGVNCAPVLPGITDSLSNLEEVVAAAAAAKARNIFANTLFLKPCSAAVFLPFLEQAFPHLVEQYRTRYHGRAFLPPVYTRRVSDMMNQLRKKYGFHKPARQDRYEDYAMEQPPPVDDQMKLF